MCAPGGSRSPPPTLVWLAQTPALGSLRFRRNFRSPSCSARRVLLPAMPISHRFYAPGELQFLTSGTYRRTTVFLSDRFRLCAAAGRGTAAPAFLLIGWVLMTEFWLLSGHVTHIGRVAPPCPVTHTSNSMCAPPDARELAGWRTVKLCVSLRRSVAPMRQPL